MTVMKCQCAEFQIPVGLGNTGKELIHWCTTVKSPDYYHHYYYYNYYYYLLLLLFIITIIYE